MLSHHLAITSADQLLCLAPIWPMFCSRRFRVCNFRLRHTSTTLSGTENTTATPLLSLCVPLVLTSQPSSHSTTSICLPHAESRSSPLRFMPHALLRVDCPGTQGWPHGRHYFPRPRAGASAQVIGPRCARGEFRVVRLLALNLVRQTGSSRAQQQYQHLLSRAPTFPSKCHGCLLRTQWDRLCLHLISCSFPGKYSSMPGRASASRTPYRLQAAGQWWAFDGVTTL
jgi:hypothetical protein